MYLLSVIVPVYNVEPYLDECLSHLEKLGPRAQIILADDGSTDNSYSICKKYASRNDNIILLHQENKGPSGARNLALNSATGKYVTFCDADDWLDETLITELEKHESQDIDCFQFGVNGDFELLYDETTLLNEEQRQDLFSLIVGLKDKRNIGHGYFGWSTCKVFRRELLEGLNFDLYVIGEDTLYAVQAFSRVKSVVYLPYRFYHYRIVEGSYSRRYSPNIVPMATRLLYLMKMELPDSKLMRNSFDCRAVYIFWWCLHASLIDQHSYKETLERLRQLYRIPVFRSAFKNDEIVQIRSGGKKKFSFMRFGLMSPVAFYISHGRS